jgi:chemotaxis protein CheD
MTGRVYLGPGELLIAEEPTIVTTVLGSCVAVTMYTRSKKLGAICHAMLPYAHPNTTSSFRYVDTSLLYMLEFFRQKGIKEADIEAKLIGGGDVLDHISTVSASVGQQNITAALELLKKEGIQLAARDIGGPLGRKIHFHTHTGKVLLSRVNRLSNNNMARAYAQ